jgi:hypothetical protein
MTPNNFDWFLYTMLLYHTKFVVQKKAEIEAEVSKDEDGNDEV